LGFDGEAAQPHPDNGRPAGKQRQCGEGPERRPLFEDGRGDADAFGNVVDGKADDQERPEPS
jgi:hypothetical protein